MKKSIKILSLVLALALICGALVVSVFAATANDAEFQATGVKVLVGQDLESATVGKGAKATDEGTKNTATSFATGMTGNIVARWGQAYIEASPYEDNKYINFSSLSNPYWVSANGAPYLSSGYKAIAQMIDVNNAYTYKYQVMDLEVTFPTGVAMNFSPRIEQRGYKPDGTTSSVAGPSFKIWSEDSATDKNIYLQDVYGTDNPIVTIPATTWTHITYIIECVDTWTTATGEPCAQTDAGAVKSLDLYGYLVVNDQIISKSYYGNNITRYNAQNFCFSEVRLNSNVNHADKSTYIKNAAIALDNFSWRGINPAEYAKIGELKAALATTSLAGWTDSLYDENDVNVGTPVATAIDGDSIKYYDSLEKAIDATATGGTVKLIADVTEEVTVKKVITVLKNGYTANLNALGVKLTETADAYVFETSNAKMTVKMQACKCGNGCIAPKTITVYSGANIWDAIVAEYGKEPSCSYSDGDIQYNFDGFTVTGTAAAFFEGGKLDKTTIVSEAFADTVATVNVAYKAIAPIAKVFKADGTLSATYYAGTNFQTIQAKADGMTGSKIVLYADFSTEDGALFHKYNTHSFTFDLNGYTFKHVIKANETAKGDGKSVFYPNGNGVIITITSSQVGGKIFNSACHLKSDRPAVPFIQTNTDGSGVKFIGANANGETTLSFYGNEPVQSYGKRASVEVDGGYYMRNRGDNYALFDMRVLADCSFKNATFEATVGPIFVFCGRTAGMGTNKANVTIDNCVMLADTVIDYIADPITVTITNSVIGGNMTLRSETSAVAANGDEVIIGRGCKLKEGITFGNKGVVYAGEVQDVEELLTFTTAYNTWKVGEDNFKITEYTTNVYVAKVIADVFDVEFTKGGTTIYTAKVYKGMNASVPMGAVEGTGGMVEQVASVQIPETVKSGDKIEITSDAEISYVAGKVPVQFSLSITGHTSYNFFLPVVEGITYDATNALQHNLPGYNPKRGATTTYNVDATGNKWMRINTWPGMHLVDESGSIVINYSYKGVALTYAIESFGVIDYCDYIINGGTNYPIEMKNAVANMLDTVYYFNTVKSSSINAKLTAVMESDAYKTVYKAYEAPTGASNKAVYDKMAADGYIKEIALIAMGANSGITAGVKMNGTYGFKMTTKTAIKFNASLVGENRIDGTGYFYMHNIRAYAFNEVFTIEVYEGYTANMSGTTESNVKTFNGEVLATYEWTLAGYINDNASTLTATQLAYAKSIYSYAEAASKYLQWKQDNGYDLFT